MAAPPPAPPASGRGARLAEPKGEASHSGVGKPQSTKLSYKDQRDYEQLPAKIEELEAAIAKAQYILADPDLFSADPKRFATISKGLENAQAQKADAEERWLLLAEKVEG